MPNHGLMNQVRNMPRLYQATMTVRDLFSHFKSLRGGSFAQHGEDLFVADFFEGKKGFYLDIGASHPFRISNTYLLYRAGWRGATVEPIPRLGNLHRKWRPRDTLFPVAVGKASGTIEFFELTPSVLSTLDRAVADQYVSEGRAVLHRAYRIEVMPINDVLTRATAIAPVDFLSMDIEGLDVSVLSQIDFGRFRPKLICVEFNDPLVRRQMETTLARAEYRVVSEIGCNLMAAPHLET